MHLFTVSWLVLTHRIRWHCRLQAAIRLQVKTLVSIVSRLNYIVIRRILYINYYQPKTPMQSHFAEIDITSKTWDAGGFIPYPADAEIEVNRKTTRRELFLAKEIGEKTLRLHSHGSGHNLDPELLCACRGEIKSYGEPWSKIVSDWFQQKTIKVFLIGPFKFAWERLNVCLACERFSLEMLK